jgi:thiol:disulfide interchange protein DsbD
MRYLLSLILSLPFFSFSQQSPVQFEAFSRKTGNNTYVIELKGRIAEGWHVFAENKTVSELEPPEISWENELVQIEQTIVNGHVKKAKDKLFDNKELNVYTGELSLIQRILIKGDVPAQLQFRITGFAAKGDEFIPIENTCNVALEGGSNKAAAAIKISSVDLSKPLSDCGGEDTSGKGLLAIFFLGFAGGLIALLTPCVFPMVPVTVSFFTNRAPNRKVAVKNGFLYGFFIFLIYIMASLPFHLLSDINPEIFNTISTNAWVNLSFFAIFIFFALSFFGFFEIALPGSFTSKTANKSELGSVGGIFFMALTLALVSFSCTGPILGSLLVGSLLSNAGAWQLTAGMSGFGIALALPFGLFAMFPNWLKSLPKSGGWMDTVKKVLAFIELALALKFLSNADLVMHWGIVKREVFIGSWLLISIGLTLYLFGVLRLPHDYKGQKISVARKIIGVASFFFALYLIPGVTQTKYANLQLLSGFPPPLSYSVYGKENVHGKGVEPKVINDYEKALQLSKEQHKPILIDFTGWACVNCRKMEEQIWTSPDIATLINEKFILVSLYVDDRQKLPAGKRFTYRFSDGKEKQIVTVGDRWATFQAENFSQASQPLYVVLNADEKLMNLPVGYTPNKEAYKQWLQCALDANSKGGQLAEK